MSSLYLCLGMSKLVAMLKPLADASDRALSGTALVRIDVNAEDAWRLEAVVPTIEYLADRAKRVIVISHKGRPTVGQRLGSLSLWSDAQKLSELLDRDVWFITDTTVPAVRAELAKLPEGGVVMLENIRAFKGEGSDSATFAQSLAGLGDYFVSDAFPVLHHPAASVTGLPRVMTSYAGFQLMEEMDSLERLQDRVKHPYVVVIGGAKAKDKLGVLEEVIEKADKVLVGGACANALLALSGVNVGNSIYERDAKLLAALKPFVGHKKIMLPTDFVRSGGKILDIGPKTALVFSKELGKAKTILWTGPLGMIEKARFAKGTLVVAKAIARNKQAFSVTGGGETVSFLKANKLDGRFSFISTGGGAMIEYVSGHELPGIKALAGGKKSSPTKAKPEALALKIKSAILPVYPKVAPVYDLFFHDDLDGRASAAVFIDFLRSKKSRVARLIPVEHDLKDIWLKKDALNRIAGTKKLNPAIIVDFPYHPQATFWYDHHPGAIRLPEWEAKYQPSAFKRLETTYASACHLVYDSLIQEFGYVPAPHIKELVRWADVVDSARYKNPFQTFALREPALQVSSFISAEAAEAAKRGERTDALAWLIELMATHGIDRASRDKRVQDVIVRVREDSKKSLSFYRKNLIVNGIVAIIDTSDLETRKLRYAPYYLSNTAIFALAISHRADDSYIIQVGVSPWKRERNSFNIGGILKQFGGGGHPFAGAVRLTDRKEVDRVVEYFVTLFNGSTS